MKRAAAERSYLQQDGIRGYLRCEYTGIYLPFLKNVIHFKISSELLFKSKYIFVIRVAQLKFAPEAVS